MRCRIHVLGLALLSACASNGRDFSFEDARRIRVGMSEREVLAIMGSPTNKSVSLNSELRMWIYVTVAPFSPPNSKSFSVKLDNGVVVFINGEAASGAGAGAIPQARKLGILFEQALPGGGHVPRITKIVSGGLADKAGWQVDDLLLSVDGAEVRTANDAVVLTQSGRNTKTYTIQRGAEVVTSQIQFAK